MAISLLTATHPSYNDDKFVFFQVTFGGVASSVQTISLSYRISDSTGSYTSIPVPIEAYRNAFSGNSGLVFTHFYSLPDYEDYEIRCQVTYANGTVDTTTDTIILEPRDPNTWSLKIDFIAPETSSSSFMDRLLPVEYQPDGMQSTNVQLEVIPAADFDPNDYLSTSWLLNGEYITPYYSAENGRIIKTILPTMLPETSPKNLTANSQTYKWIDHPYYGHIRIYYNQPLGVSIRPTYYGVPARSQLSINGYSDDGRQYSVGSIMNLTQKVWRGSKRISSFGYTYSRYDDSGNLIESGTLNYDSSSPANAIDFTDVGNYTITLTVTDVDGDVATTDTIAFKLIPAPPLSLKFEIADNSGNKNYNSFITRNPATGVASLSLIARCEALLGAPYSAEYYLDSGAGYVFQANRFFEASDTEIDPFTGQNITKLVCVSNYVFNNPGTYKWKIIVTDYDGRTAESISTFTLSAYPPVLNLDMYPTSDYEPLTVNFKQRSSEGLVRLGTYNLSSVGFYYAKVTNGIQGSKVLFKQFNSTYSTYIPEFSHSFNSPGDYRLFAVVKDANARVEEDLNFMIGEITVTQLPQAVVELTDDGVPPFKIGNTITITPNYGDYPMHKIQNATWRYNFGARSHTIVNSNSLGSWTISNPLVLNWSEAGNFTVQLEILTAKNEVVKSNIMRYKIYNDIVASSYRIEIVMDPDQRAATATSEAAACDSLYNSLIEASKNNSLYFAPRTWDEAGKITNISKTSILRNSTLVPAISITIPKRVSDKKSGVEAIDYSSLLINPIDRKEDNETSPRPRGVVFCTPAKKETNVIRLSAGERYTFVDKHGKTIVKEGLALNPVVLYAQNSQDQNYNAFGSATAIKNLDFSQYPFQPYFTLLREDEYNLTTTSKSKFCAVTYDSLIRDNLTYSPQYIHSISPFDVNYLKFRRQQNVETSSLEEDSSANAWETTSSTSNWGRGDIPNNTTTIGDKTGWKQSSVSLTWSNAGSLLLPATSGSESNKYTTQFYGQPNTGGLVGNVEKYARRAQFESADNLYTKYGVVDSGGNSGTRFTLNNFSIDGAASSALIGESQIISKTSSSLVPGLNDIIKPVGKSGRYYAFPKQKRIYLWDDYLSKDVSSYALLGGVSESIINLEKVGDIKILESNLLYNVENNKFTKFPLSPKYFDGSTILLNLNYNNEITNWATTYSTLTSNQELPLTIDYTKGASKVIYADPFDNFVYYSTSSYIGISNLGDRNNTYYHIDTKTGQITEGSEGSNKFIQLNKAEALINIESAVLPVELHPENEAQSVAVNGLFGNLPFSTSASIVLADHVKPQINGGITKLWVNDPNFNNPLMIKFRTKEWIPDRITLCPEQLIDTDAYVSYFEDAEGQQNVTISNIGSDVYEITVLAENLQESWKASSGNYASGTHFITLGLETFPSGKRSNGYRANYHQNNMRELIDNFSTNVVLVDNRQIRTTITNSTTRSDGTTTLLDDNLTCSLNVLAINTVSNIDSVYLNESGNTVIKSQTSFNVFETALAESGSYNRFSGNSLITSNGDIFTVLSNTETEITLYGNCLDQMQSVDRVSIAPFIPTYYIIKTSLGESSSINKLKFKQLTSGGQIKFESFAHAIKRIQGNNIVIEYLDENKSFSVKYYPKLVFTNVGTNDLSAGSTTATISFYGIYDADTKVFSRQLSIGARAKDSQFYHIFSDSGLDDEDEIFIQIQTSDDLDITKEITLKLINNNTGAEVFESPYLFSESAIEQVIDDNKTLFKAILKRDQDTLAESLLDVSIEFSAYDKYGNLVEIK